MTSINVNLGDAFLLETPPNDQHLYIAIAKTSADKYLFVNVTTRRAKSDLPLRKLGISACLDLAIAYRIGWSHI
jgi:hypothetical protein